MHQPPPPPAPGPVIPGPTIRGPTDKSGPSKLTIGCLGLLLIVGAFISYGLIAMGLATLLQTTIVNRLPIVQGPSATLQRPSVWRIRGLGCWL